MTKKMLTAALAAPLALAMASPAAAATFFTFQMSGAVTGSFRIADTAFTAPAETTSDYFVVEGNFPGTVNGDAVNVASVTFNTESWGGGLTAELPNGVFVGLIGDQLFTGTTAAPTLRLGTFSLTDDTAGDAVSLTIGQAVENAVPEPATWGLMILGFGAVGSAMRRRGATRVRVRYAA